MPTGVHHVLIPGSTKQWIVNFDATPGPRVTGRHRNLGVPIYSHPTPTQRRKAIEIATRIAEAAAAEPTLEALAASAVQAAPAAPREYTVCLRYLSGGTKTLTIRASSEMDVYNRLAAQGHKAQVKWIL